MGRQAKYFYEFGPFRLDPGEGLLLRDGQAVPISPKSFDTLLTLVENGGHVVSKGELLQAVWPDSFVEEANLAHHISALRKALGDGAGGIRYIETVPKRGYRFVAEVRRLPETKMAVRLEERTLSSVVIEEETDDREEIDVAVEVAVPAGATATGRGSTAAASDGRIRRFVRAPALSLVAVALVVGLALVAFQLGRSSKAEQPEAPATGMATIRAIAVLPFKPLNGSDRDEPFELGMADTLITKLSNLQQIIVRPTSAVRNYISLEQNAVAAGRELKVDLVLEGNIQRSGDKIRITVRLMDVKQGSQVWAYKCDELCTDVFALQDAISEDVAQALTLKLTGEDGRLLAKRYTENPEAYQLYVKGRYFWNKRTDESLMKSVDYYQQAIDKDPNYALAYSGLADSYIVLGSWASSAIAPKEALRKAKAAAMKALEIDASLAEAHAALADVGLLYEWDWATVEREFKLALALNPHYATAHQWYGNYLAAMGRLDEAIAETKLAQTIDPLSLIISSSLGSRLYLARRYDEALEQFRKTLDMDANFGDAHVGLAKVYLQKGMHSEANAAVKKALALREGSPVILAAVGYVYAVSGDAAQAVKVLRKLEKLAKQRYVSSYDVAVVYAGLGKNDGAFEWLEEAYAERASYMIFLKADPRLDGLRSDPRFADLVHRVGLPQ